MKDLIYGMKLDIKINIAGQMTKIDYDYKVFKY